MIKHIKKVPKRVLDGQISETQMINDDKKYVGLAGNIYEYIEIEKNRDGIRKEFEIMMHNEMQHLSDKIDARIEKYDEIRRMIPEHTDEYVDAKAFDLSADDKPVPVSTLKSIQNDIVSYNSLSGDRERMEQSKNIIDMKLKLAELQLKFTEGLEWEV